jgi:ATP-dependent Clp protease adaptor protein ClpS
VLLLNDDYTPMEFVVHVLQQFFSKSAEEATRIMLHVHQKGVGVCGVYTFEIAETKVTQVMDFAKKHQQPPMHHGKNRAFAPCFRVNPAGLERSFNTSWRVRPMSAHAVIKAEQHGAGGGAFPGLAHALEGVLEE